MVADLPLVTIPSSGPHTHTIILLHHSGSFAHDLVNSTHNATDSHWRSLIQNYASVRWVFPQAAADHPPTIEATVKSIKTGIQNFTGTEPPWWWRDEPTEAEEEASKKVERVRTAVLAMRRVLRNEAALLKGRWDRIVLGGIGHGAGIAVQTLANIVIPLNEDVSLSRGSNTSAELQVSLRRIGSFVGVGCEMPFPGLSLAATRQLLALDPLANENDASKPDDILKNTPFLLQHFLDHSPVGIAHSFSFRDTLVSSGVERLIWKEYADTGPLCNSPMGVEDLKELFKQTMELRPN